MPTIILPPLIKGRIILFFGILRVTTILKPKVFYPTAILLNFITLYEYSEVHSRIFRQGVVPPYSTISYECSKTLGSKELYSMMEVPFRFHLNEFAIAGPCKYVVS